MISRNTFRCFTGLLLLSLSHGKSLQLVEDQLASDCFNPSGENCNWYKECLEKRYQCEKTSYPYAISFAEHFCSRFGTMYNSFSAKGKQWIDATRKCLQVALVPLLDPSKVPTCKEIRRFAFKSHTPCYVTPSPQGPSMCDLPFTDWLHVFHTIKSAFFKAAIPSIQGAFGTLGRCVSQGK